MTQFEKLEKFLWYLFDKLGLGEKHKKRLEWEIREVDVQVKADYFLGLYESKSKLHNQNNIIIPYILGICDEFDINHDPVFVQGDMPDIDVDYLSEVRDYLKNTWAVKTFGEDYVCNIGNYTTYGMKSALIDMARVHGESREEMLELTKLLDSKDDEGNRLTWDNALRLYPKLKDYCEKHPDIAESAKKLINRNRGMGQHAGGLIISSIPLHDLVPLVKRKDNPQASAWVEGLNGQDLQPVGLVKFDLLVISNLQQIFKCCELVRLRHNIKNICALDGQSDWTDMLAWRNDSKSIAMANDGDLKCIFQFDSEGIRRLVRSGGVDRFEDMVAYTALYRPGPLGMLMHERYIKRKRGEEQYVLHPLLQPILGSTYGVMCYQEQTMKILNVVGEVPLRDCEVLRKAISKKKVDGFIKYKQLFIVNGQRNLNCEEKEIVHLWDTIESFAEYAFNASHAVAYTYISSRLLYLKSHYPPEFYTAVLSCENLSEKIKDYKIEARRHGVDMHKVDINKSKENFDLIGDVMYFGFSNVKGIGESVAKKIVAGQPYSNFEDFLYRFGTDASVIKCLIGLRCFNDSDPITMWKFYEHYKDCFNKIEEKKKRFLASMELYEEEYKKIMPNDIRNFSGFSGDNPFSGEEWEALNVNSEIEVEKKVESDSGESRIEIEYIPIVGTDDFIEVQNTRYKKTIIVKKIYNKLKELKKLWVRRQKAIERHIEACRLELPKLINFDSSKYQIDRAFANELKKETVCEQKYYGFSWMHSLEKSADFKGITYQTLRSYDGCIAPVEVEILKVKRCLSKNDKEYVQIVAEDAVGESNRINIFYDDFKRWKEELKKGNLIRIRLSGPSGGFTSYTLEKNQKIPNRGWALIYPTKESDFRIVVLSKTDDEDKFQTDEEVLGQFDGLAK